MNRTRRFVATSFAVACCLLTACHDNHNSKLAVPFYRTAELTPEWLSADVANAQSMHRVGAFTLTDQNGASISQSAFANHATIIHFFFTTCAGICPTTQSNIARLLAKMSDESRVQVLSYSVMPERDPVRCSRCTPKCMTSTASNGTC